MALRESVDALLAHLVRAKDHAHGVRFQELFDAGHTEFGDVVNTHWVSCYVGGHVVGKDATLLFFCIHGVAPEDVNEELLLCRSDFAKIDLNGSLYLLDVLNLNNRRADPSMNAEHLVLRALVLDNGGKGHMVKQFIYPLKHTPRQVYVLLQPLRALLSETQVAVHISVFVVSS